MQFDSYMVLDTEVGFLLEPIFASCQDPIWGQFSTQFEEIIISNLDLL